MNGEADIVNLQEPMYEVEIEPRNLAESASVSAPAGIYAMCGLAKLVDLGEP